MDLSRLRIGYAPYTPALDNPGDRRRFCYYAKARGIKLDLVAPGTQEVDHDVVVLSERADITTWSRLPRGRTKVIYDLIDSYLSLPRTDAKALLRGAAKFVSRQYRHLRLDHWRAIEAMCRRADAVICSTTAQAARIRPLCANVHRILDVHTMVATQRKQSYERGEVLSLVWEGLPHNAPSLWQLQPVLQALERHTKVELHVITDPEYYQFVSRFRRRNTWELLRGLHPRLHLHGWSESQNARLITGCDLAVIPVDLKRPMDAGKPENKLLLFWRMGMPTVTTATDAYRDAMRAAGLDMACRTTDDWLRTLTHYAGDAAARRQAAEQGSAHAEREHGEAAILARWDAALASVLSR